MARTMAATPKQSVSKVEAESEERMTDQSQVNRKTKVSNQS